ncbi:MAG: SGNH/GDSL hydrolase family protein [Planctomycetota bacterium]
MFSNRRGFLLSSSALLAGAAHVAGAAHGMPVDYNYAAGRIHNKLRQSGSASHPEIAWFDPREWGVEGRGFDDTKKFYDRLPMRAEGKVRDAVWQLSRHASGISFRFRTDSPEIHVKYRLSQQRLAMPHMPATGVSGVDLYARDDEGRWRYVTVLKVNNQDVETRLVGGLRQTGNGDPREFMIYLPLYNGVERLQLGVSSAATMEPVPPRTEKPIVFYGTSIMHGACASRPGMSISAIVGRRMERPTINLGFSGNGRMEAEVGEFLVELDPCVFAIDCLPNMNAESVTSNCEPLVRQIRAARPDTPILLVEDRVNTGAWIRAGALERHSRNQAALKRAFDNLQQAGIANLHYLESESLLGDDNEGATDGSHPSDLGMVRYADAYESKLNEIL